MNSIKDSKISPMLKGKILATYFPDRYLNVFDNEHLTHYLRVLNLDTESLVKKDPVYKREALRKFKDKDPDMRHWDLDVFGKFLYQNFPPTKGGPDKKADDYFPTTDKYSYVDYSINYEDTSTKDKRKGIAPKVDYEKEARKYRRYGDRGEKIVIKAEIDRLMAELGLTQKQAEKAVIPMSQDSDSHGYDIKSLNPDGSFRYIEVKATTGKAGDVEFYYTENEFEKSKEYGKDYYIYIVYEIRSSNPKIWRIQNPFLFGSLTMRPVQYKVTVHAKL